MSGQQEIDFGYFDRRGLIADANLGRGVAACGAGVSEATMKAVLHAINDRYGANGESWPSQQTIANEAGIARKTVGRAIEALQNRSLVITERRKSSGGLVCNHYRIVWSELMILSRGRARKAAPVEAPKVHGVPHQRDMVSHRPMGHGDRPMGHGVPYQRDMVSHELLIEPIKKPTTPNPRQEPTDPWAVVAELVLSLDPERRPTAWQSAIEAAKAAGVSAEHAAAIVRHYAEHRGWQGGALVRRLQRADERIAPTEGWPAEGGRSTASVSLASPTSQFEFLRTRIVKAGQAAGDSEAVIEDRVRRARERFSSKTGFVFQTV